MTTGVIYLLTSMKLASRLMVSLYTLRKWYSGPITIVTTKPKAHQFAQLLAADPRLRVDVQKCQQRPGRGYQAAYLTKTAIIKYSPYEATIFLDADTVVVGSISELSDYAISATVTATQFGDWTTTDKIMRQRIREWRPLIKEAPHVTDLKRLINLALGNPFAAVNAGVFAVQRDSIFMQQWDLLAWAARNYRFPDELSLQLLLPTTDHYILGSQFNAHPYMIFNSRFARIWHFACSTHLAEGCASIWLKAYDECYEENLAGIKAWMPSTAREKMS